MPFITDMTGVKPMNQGIPDGWYNLRIIKAEAGTTTKGDDKVTCDLEIVGGDYDGIFIKFHNVIFPKDKTVKWAGIGVHFLKCINLPHEGKFAVNERDWNGRVIYANVVTEANPVTGKKYPKVKTVEKTGMSDVNPPLSNNSTTEDEEVPF